VFTKKRGAATRGKPNILLQRGIGNGGKEWRKILGRENYRGPRLMHQTEGMEKNNVQQVTGLWKKKNKGNKGPRKTT